MVTRNVIHTGCRQKASRSLAVRWALKPPVVPTERPPQARELLCCHPYADISVQSASKCHHMRHLRVSWILYSSRSCISVCMFLYASSPGLARLLKSVKIHLFGIAKLINSQFLSWRQSCFLTHHWLFATMNWPSLSKTLRFACFRTGLWPRTAKEMLPPVFFLLEPRWPRGFTTLLLFLSWLLSVCCTVPFPL